MTRPLADLRGYRRVVRLWRPYEGAKQDGIALAFVLYDFRHTFATWVAQAGIDLATLAAILGHNSIRIVQR